MSKQEKKTILLIEDEILIALNEKLELEHYNYKVETVTSGEKAIEYIKEKNDVDLILMDINLGRGIDGTETSQEILNERDIPIVFLSSHTDPDIVKKTEKITSYGYVLKNSGITVLDASIKMAFKLHEAKMKKKEIEISLLENEFYLKKAQEMSKIGHFNYDPVSKIIISSNELFKIFDIDKTKPLFETFAKAVHPDDGHLIFPFIERVLEKGIPYSVEHRENIKTELFFMYMQKVNFLNQVKAKKWWALFRI